MAIFGIDIHKFTEVTNWASVAAHVDFCYVKASQGRVESAPDDSPLVPFTDSKAHSNVVNSQKAGIKTGAYHLLTATSVVEARTEAKFFINFLNNHRSYLTLPPVVDLESVHLPSNKTVFSNIYSNFMQVMRSNGYTPWFYTNESWIKTRFSAEPTDGLWLAKWGNKMPSKAERSNLKIWQYGTVAVPGIKSPVDANIMVSN